MTAVEVVATGLAVVGVALALVLSAVGVRAYRRTGSARYRTAAGGFLLVSAGLAAEPAALRVGSLPSATVHAVEALLFALGLGALYVSVN